MIGTLRFARDGRDRIATLDGDGTWSSPDGWVAEMLNGVFDPRTVYFEGGISPAEGTPTRQLTEAASRLNGTIRVVIDPRDEDDRAVDPELFRHAQIQADILAALVGEDAAIDALTPPPPKPRIDIRDLGDGRELVIDTESGSAVIRATSP